MTEAEMTDVETVVDPEAMDEALELAQKAFTLSRPEGVPGVDKAKLKDEIMACLIEGGMSSDFHHGTDTISFAVHFHLRCCMRAF